MLEIFRTHGMRMELEAAQVREPSKCSGIARHDLFGRTPGGELELGHFDPLWPRSRGTLLIEELAFDSVRIPNEHVRSSARTLERARRNGEVVAHEIELRVLSFREEHLVRPRDRDRPASDHERLFVPASILASASRRHVS